MTEKQCDTRALDAEQIKAAYDEADRALQMVGKIIRTSKAGKYIWASDHKTAISGLRVVVRKLRNDVPRYKLETP